jgi:hypothetical protein
MNWTGIWNRLWRLLDMSAPCYFSGPRFLAAIREVNLDLPQYGELMEQRRQANLSTSRRDYFRDIFMELNEASRVRVVGAILDEIHACDESMTAEIRALLAGGVAGPSGKVPPKLWNADRLNRLLSEMDTAIASTQYDRAVGLAYTCLEGFYGAFFRAKAPGQPAPNEIIALSRWIRDHLRATIVDYPDEVLNLLGQTAHAVDRARNRFSEAHFAGEAGRWLATYCRDLVNSQVRLLLHFM